MSSIANSTREVQPDIVSYWYFGTSVAVWFATPLLYMPMTIKTGGVGFPFEEVDKCRFEIPKCVWLKKWYLMPIYIMVKATLYYLASILWVYFIIPVTDMVFAAKNVFCHEKFKGNEDESTYFHVYIHENERGFYDGMPILKLFEQFGEAVPQFTIALTFYLKNYHWLESDELTFGILTMTLSLGSIMIGVVSGIIKGRKQNIFNDLCTEISSLL